MIEVTWAVLILAAAATFVAVWQYANTAYPHIDDVLADLDREDHEDRDREEKNLAKVGTQ